MCLILNNLPVRLAQFMVCENANELSMDKDDFRNYSALLILTVLIDRTTNPAKAAVFWANELIKELYEDKSKK